MRVPMTAEAPGEGHPDKIADQISDAVLDSVLAQDPVGRVACEVFITTGLVLVGGEISTTGYVDVPMIARDVVRDIGYTSSEYGFDADAVSVLSAIQMQSPDIAQSVVGKKGKVIGAGDQGMMFGYACDETPERMPLAYLKSQQMLESVAKLRKSGDCEWMRPDSKGMVTVVYEDGIPRHVSSIVLSVQHDEKVSLDDIQAFCREKVLNPLFGELLNEKTRVCINPSGKFVIGGPRGDTGLTGRKIIADTYGGFAHHGGGAFSGKDPSKVDRSAAYMARHIAKTIVEAELATRCEVQLSYAIGVPEPIEYSVATFASGKVPDEHLSSCISKVFDCSPEGIIRRFDLHRPLYRKTAVYGHFGRAMFPWEQVDRSTLQSLLNAVS